MKNDFKEFLEIINDKDIMEVKNEIIVEATGALLGDANSIKEIFEKTGLMIISVKDTIFLIKFIKFIKGVYKDSSDIIRLSTNLFGDENKKNSNAIRIIQIIDKVENEESLKFVINTTRAFLLGKIDVNMYFRICRAISDTLYEDLLFLKGNVFDENEFRGNEIVHGLNRSGLMISSGIDGNADINNQEYCISDFGRLVDKYALSFDDDEHWQKHSKLDKTMRE